MAGRRFCPSCGAALGAPGDAVQGKASADYAERAPLPSYGREPRAPRRLWGGPRRRALLVGCWVAAVLLMVPLLLPLLAPAEAGAETPEGAVGELLQGVADLDAVAVARVVDPDEIGDPARLQAGYDDLVGRVRRAGEVPPEDITAVVAAAEDQLGATTLSREALATLAAVDMDLDDLALEVEDLGDGRARVYLTGGELDVDVDPGDLPESVRDEVRGLDRASYDTPLTQGWSLDGDPFEAYLVAVEVGGRWFVSLGATADDLGGGRP